MMDAEARRTIEPVVLRLTLVAVLLTAAGHWSIRFPTLLGAGVLLALPRLQRTPWPWLALAALVAARVVHRWPLADNHVYLAAYWLLAIGLALASRTPRAALAAGARPLVGLVFAFAVLWKAFLSPDYLDGRFYRVTLLTDDRFAGAVRLFGGLAEDDLAANREILTPLRGGAVPFEAPDLHEPPAFRRLVVAATWGSLALEAVIAALFLAPLASAEAARHAALLAFCVGTYALAPVAGFAWLLLSMGAAQCRTRERAWSVAYVAVFFLVLGYSEVPWAPLLANSLGVTAAAP